MGAFLAGGFVPKREIAFGIARAAVENFAAPGSFFRHFAFHAFGAGEIQIVFNIFREAAFGEIGAGVEFAKTAGAD